MAWVIVLVETVPVMVPPLKATEVIVLLARLAEETSLPPDTVSVVPFATTKSQLVVIDWGVKVQM